MCVVPFFGVVQDGKILGCQAVGEGEGVDKVVDVMATLVQKQGSVYDLEEAELCYAPQYGSAKSVANIAGDSISARCSVLSSRDQSRSTAAVVKEETTASLMQPEAAVANTLWSGTQCSRHTISCQLAALSPLLNMQASLCDVICLVCLQAWWLPTCCGVTTPWCTGQRWTGRH
jgi:hypothetical protein